MNEFKELIDSFIAYRNILTPLQESLRSVVESYGSIKDDLTRLDKTFSGETKQQLDKIYSTLSAQAKSSQELAQKIEKFSESSDKYIQAVTEMTNKFSGIEQKLRAVDELEKTAEAQLSRLDEIIEEKRVSYNVKDLQRTLDSYNKNVEKVSEFINKDIALVLQQNGKTIDEIRRENESLSKEVAQQNKTVAELIGTFRETTSLLRKSVDSESVNEEYLFDILDKWASDRKVKIKKK